jgi:hypothetical protein
VTSAPDQLDAIVPVPAGSSVLHIGPHKTGTTALQHAMRQARADMLAQGVRLAGRGPGDADGVRYAIGVRAVRGEEAGREIWEKIKGDLADASVPRRVFSCETFASTPARAIERVVDELGQVHVVISARPLAELLPSQYGQFVQRGLTTMPFDPWVDAVLRGDDERTVKLFWKRHSHDVLVRRWGGLVGADRVTLLVVDGRDRLFVPRVFEQLLGLDPGTLCEKMAGARTNRALTIAELDLVREWHEVCDQGGIDRVELVRLVWKLCDHFRRLDPRPADPTPTLPDWAVSAANERAAVSAAAIATSGARIVGDLRSLSAVRAPA